MPDLARCTFTNAVESQSHRSLMGRQCHFCLPDGKMEAPWGGPIGGRGGCNGKQHWINSEAHSLTTEPYSVKTPEKSNSLLQGLSPRKNILIPNWICHCPSGWLGSLSFGPLTLRVEIRPVRKWVKTLEDSWSPCTSHFQMLGYFTYSQRGDCFLPVKIRIMPHIGERTLF